MRRDELRLVHEGLNAEEPTIYFEKLMKAEIKQLKQETRTIASRKRASPAIDDPASLPVTKHICLTASTSASLAPSSSAPSLTVTSCASAADTPIASELDMSAAFEPEPSTPDMEM